MTYTAAIPGKRLLSMRAIIIVCCSLLLSVFSFALPSLADEFVEFFTKQKIGQEITVTGGYRKFSYKRHFFQRNYRTGEITNYHYFGLSMVPTHIIGDGALAIKASLFDTMLFVYEDEDIVKDLPEHGEGLWFTGTLIGYQYGISGITSGALSGGDPYVLLQRVSTEPPRGAVSLKAPLKDTSPQLQFPPLTAEGPEQTP